MSNFTSYEFLERIEKTNLLFEDKSLLAAYLGLDEKYFINRNALSDKNRSKIKVDKDLKSLCDYAYLISANIDPMNNDLMLVEIIEDYSAATESGHFSNPKNNRHKRHVNHQTIFNKVKYDIGKLHTAIANLINNKANSKDEPLYRALRIDINAPHTIYRNHYAALGILIYLGLIPFCDERTRIRATNWNLEKETKEALNFLKELTDEVAVQRCIEMIFTNYKKHHSMHWCRYLLILCFSRMLDEIVNLKNKKLVEQYQKSLKSRHIIPKRKYWYDHNKNDYILERLGQGDYYDMYLYRCEFKIFDNKYHLTKERFNFKIGKATVEISHIDDFYKGITGGDDYTSSGTIYEMNESHIKITPDFPEDFPKYFIDLIPMPEDRIKELEDKINKSAHTTLLESDKAIENLEHYANLSSIMTKKRTIWLSDGADNPVAVITPNEANKLNSEFENITATDNIFIYKSNESMHLVTIINGLMKSFDITHDPSEYGIKFLDGR